MKNGLLVSLLSLSSICSCDMLGPQKDRIDSVHASGELRVAFDEQENYLTRTDITIQDTCSFQLCVEDSKGRKLYEGRYGELPETIAVSPGTYRVSVRSSSFSRPSFDLPVFGDDQCVDVPSGGVCNVRLKCVQQNSGVRLKVDRSFLDGFPDGALILKSSQGSLMYAYSEKRFAYFVPGKVSLFLSSGGEDRQLVSWNLAAADMLTVSVSSSSSKDSAMSQPKGSIAVSVDTTRNWISDIYEIGGSASSEDDPEEVLTVARAMNEAGRTDVWVSGYIVGGDLTSASMSFSEPFSSRTNLVLGPRATSSLRSSCLSVQLASGDVRDALNLVDNPQVLGRKVLLKGDIVSSYFGMVGLKNITRYELR